ncbi:uncharacterized protein AKAME5_000629700 [Lates japonicus]|uniref:Ig-like domain-containing protein n=1 Tax=Lates japonicus TaxID=270547 RepID=A0AAD3R3G3_LATJO|nr:uncharacterized protein AKAME5_000629700 [Lates japonicus]
MKNLSLSHAGTYYCAVASCGHILFGNGTKLDIEDENSLVLVYVLSSALAFTIILSVLLTFLLYTIRKRNSCQCTESQARFTASSTTNAESCKNEENLHYAALRSCHNGENLRQRDDTWTEWEDVGTYYCGRLNVKDIQFGSGTFLMVKGLKMISDSIVQQPESTSVQPGDSVTLSCSVHTGHCAAEHTSVMWLKHSDHAAPEMIYSSGYKNNTCQRTKKDSEETTCVYNLLLRNLSSDDAGTYYCVVTSCGQTLLGNGTRIINNSAITKSVVSSPTIIALMLSNISLAIMMLILVWILCKSQRKESTEATDRSPEGFQASDAVTYSAVCLSPRQTTVKYSGDSVVYSDIRHCQKNPV